MIPRSPFRVPYRVSQEFANQADRYKSDKNKQGLHLGVDLVPLNASGQGFPAEVYPILDGKMRYFYETLNGLNSKYITIDTELDQPFITYLKRKGQLPTNYTGRVILNHSYIHGLEILDKDGFVDQDTPIMKCGNTGMTYTGMPPKPVPEELKGVPPYPGLHLHLQTELRNEKSIRIGNEFIDPFLILNYKAMNEFAKILNYKGEVGIFLPAEDIPQLKALGKAFGKPVETDDQGNVLNIDITV